MFALYLPYSVRHSFPPHSNPSPLVNACSEACIYLFRNLTYTPTHTVMNPFHASVDVT